MMLRLISTVITEIKSHFTLDLVEKLFNSEEIFGSNFDILVKIECKQIVIFQNWKIYE